MTTPKQLIIGLAERMKPHSTSDISKASGIAPLTLRKVRNQVNTGSLKMETLYKLTETLNSMEGREDD